MSASDEPALFTYRITPDKVPCADRTTIVRLQVTVTNETGREVPCSQLGFTIPPALTADPDAIAPSAVANTPWSNTAAGGGSFTAQPQPPVTSLQPGQTIGFVFDHVAVTGPAGPAGVTVWEVTDATRKHVLDVTKVDATLGITSFGASPVQVAPGGATRLRWSVTGADDATLSWAGQHKGVDFDGSLPFSPLVTTTYTLTATGGNGSVSQQVTVTVARAQVVSFRATPKAVALGQPTTLRWHVLNATSCTLEPGGTVVDPVTGELPVTPTAPTNYVLQAVGDGVDNDDARPFVVDLIRVTAPSFTADTADVPPGDPVRLRWVTEAASSVAIEPGPTGLPGTGDVEVRPATTTTYHLVAQGWFGPATRPVTVRVAPPALTRVRVEPDGDGRAVAIGWEAPVGDVTVDAGRGPQPVAAKGTVVVALGSSATTVVVAAAKGSWRSEAKLFLPAQSVGHLSHLELSGPDGIGAAHSTVLVDWAGPIAPYDFPVGKAETRSDFHLLYGKDHGRTGFGTGPPVGTGWLWIGGIVTDLRDTERTIGWEVHGAGSTSPGGEWRPVLGSRGPGGPDLPGRPDR